MARPKGYAKPRTVHLSVRLSEKERAVLDKLAAQASMRPSEFVRVLIGRRASA
ncbi:MAG: plasmid mobilization protein [Xanthobacteraceae bacterium]